MAVLLDLTSDMLDVLRESLRYSKKQVEDAPGTPAQLRRAKVAILDAILQQLPRIVAPIGD